MIFLPDKTKTKKNRLKAEGLPEKLAVENALKRERLAVANARN